MRVHARWAFPPCPFCPPLPAPLSRAPWPSLPLAHRTPPPSLPAPLTTPPYLPAALLSTPRTLPAPLPCLSLPLSRAPSFPAPLSTPLCPLPCFSLPHCSLPRSPCSCVHSPPPLAPLAHPPRLRSHALFVPLPTRPGIAHGTTLELAAQQKAANEVVAAAEGGGERVAKKVRGSSFLAPWLFPLMVPRCFPINPSTHPIGIVHSGRTAGPAGRH